MKYVYAFLLTSSICFASHAQVVYVDPSPDWQESVTPSTLIAQGSETRIDLDGDGVDDYYFRLDFGNFSNWWWVHLDADSPNEVVSDYLAGLLIVPFPRSLSAGSTVNGSLTWDDVSANINAVLGAVQSNAGVNETHLVNDGDHYIGLRFKISGQDHYAWMRLNATVTQSTMTVTVKDYAYESTPNTPIIVGDMGGMTSIGSVEGLDRLSFHPNPTSDLVHVSGAVEGIVDQVVIHSLTGQELMHHSNLRMPIDLSELASGTYLISFRKDGVVKRREKLFKQ